MRRNPKVFGLKRSVYTRTVLIALLEKEVPYHFAETDPFASVSDQATNNPHPFGRVPYLQHGEFGLHETSAITLYVDTMFRQIYAHSISRPAHGLPYDDQEISKGLAEAPRVLGSLEKLSQEGTVLKGDRFELADMHLVPMIDYFLRVPKAATLFGQ